MKLQAALTIALVTLSPAAAATQNEDSLIGMWGYHTEFPVGLSGSRLSAMDLTGAPAFPARKLRSTARRAISASRSPTKVGCSAAVCAATS